MTPTLADPRAEIAEVARLLDCHAAMRSGPIAIVLALLARRLRVALLFGDRLRASNLGPPAPACASVTPDANPLEHRPRPHPRRM